MQQENKKWYAVKYKNVFWNIQNTPIEGNIEKLDLLNPYAVGKNLAGINARLCASAPEMKELLDDMYDWLECYAGTIEMDKHHPVVGLLSRYEKLMENGSK